MTDEERKAWIETIESINIQIDSGFNSGYDCYSLFSNPYAELNDDIRFVKCQFCRRIEVTEVKLTDCENSRAKQDEMSVRKFKEIGWQFYEGGLHTCPKCYKMVEEVRVKT